jgi:tetratricopeptide (TPR) repeat protein
MTDNNYLLSTQAETPPVTSEEVKLLAQIGFLAATSGYVVPAIRLFEGLRVLRPGQAFPFIGLALARMTVGAFQDAVRVLREEGLRAVPESEEIQVYLGLALALAKQPQDAQRLLNTLLAKNHLDTPQIELAQGIQAQIEGYAAQKMHPKPAKVIELSSNNKLIKQSVC